MISFRDDNLAQTADTAEPTLGFTSRQQLIAIAPVFAAVGYPLARLWMTQNLWPTNYVAIVIVLTGFLFTTRRFFIPIALTIAGTWAFVAWPLLQGDVGFQSGGAIGFSLLCAVFLFEIRSRRLTRFERETLARVSKLTPAPPIPIPQAPAAKIQPTATGTPPWCPVCKASSDAIIRHDGERILDANRSALTLFGMSMPELAALPLIGIFSTERREDLTNVLGAANFDMTQTVAAAFNDDPFPIEMFNRALSAEPKGPRALVIRDLRALEDSRRSAASVGRRAQQNTCRIRDLASLAASATTEPLEHYLNTLVKSVHRWLPCSVGCFVLLWDNDAQGFSVLASSAALPLQPRDISLSDALQPLVNHLAERGEKLVIEKIDEDQLGIRQLYAHEPVNGCCAIPLMSPAGMVGILLVLDRNRRELNSEELDYLTLVGHCAASACNQAILQTQLSFYETESAAPTEPLENYE